MNKSPFAGLPTALLLGSVPLVVGCGADTGGGATAERRPPLIEAVQARSGSLPLQETVNGVVRARNQIAVTSEIAAPVVEVLVESGEAVRRGQPLVRLKEDELREQLRQATADVRLAEADAAEARARVAEIEARVGRTRTLARDDLVSDQEVEVQEAQLAALEASAEAAEARVEQARATADERRSALAETVVRSPVAGRVGQRRAEVGMRADPDDVLFVVGDLDEMRVEVPLTERMLDHVEEGMPVRIEPQGAAEPIRAALSRVSPFLAEASFTTIGEIDVDNREGRLRPGMYVTVRILYGETRRATLVPASALWESPGSGERGLFVVEDANGLEPPVEGVGQISDESRRVVFRPAASVAEGGATLGVEGVHEGEWVVVVGQHLLWEQARDAERRQAAQNDGGAAPAPGVARAGAAARPGVPTAALARVRPASWSRVQGLQSLQREDLLAGFLDKQQRVADVLGAEIPASEDEVQRVLAGAGPSSSPGEVGSGAVAGPGARGGD